MEKGLMNSVIIGETPVLSRVFQLVDSHHQNNKNIGFQMLPKDLITFTAVEESNSKQWQLSLAPFLVTRCRKSTISVVGIDCYGEHFVCRWRWDMEADKPDIERGNLRKLTESEKFAYRLLADPAWSFEPKPD